MKKMTFTLLILLTLLLTACGASNETQSGSAPASNASAGALPVQTQIIIGTFKLEGTDLAVTAEQAAELLPLWRVYSDLISSDSAAPEEIDALIEQIQETMTPEQMKAIADMKLTQENVFVTMQEQGIDMGGGPQRSGDTQNNNNNRRSFRPPDGSGMPPGDFPGGGPGQGPSGQTLSPEQIATAQAARPQGGRFNRVPPGLINALIQFLEKKAGS